MAIFWLGMLAILRNRQVIADGMSEGKRGSLMKEGRST
jgi:hypothetical protein